MHTGEVNMAVTRACLQGRVTLPGYPSIRLTPKSHTFLPFFMRRVCKAARVNIVLGPP